MPKPRKQGPLTQAWTVTSLPFLESDSVFQALICTCWVRSANPPMIQSWRGTAESLRLTAGRPTQVIWSTLPSALWGTCQSHGLSFINREEKNSLRQPLPRSVRLHQSVILTEGGWGNPAEVKHPLLAHSNSTCVLSTLLWLMDFLMMQKKGVMLALRCSNKKRDKPKHPVKEDNGK